MLEQLDFSLERRGIEIAGERDILATAIHRVLTDAIHNLDNGARDYWRGKIDLDTIDAAYDQLCGALHLLRVIEIDATAPTAGDVCAGTVGRSCV